MEFFYSYVAVDFAEVTKSWETCFSSKARTETYFSKYELCMSGKGSIEKYLCRFDSSLLHTYLCVQCISENLRLSSANLVVFLNHRNFDFAVDCAVNNLETSCRDKRLGTFLRHVLDDEKVMAHIQKRIFRCVNKLDEL
jgi:hypothetical protein